jgi:hypothetical protein
MTYFNPEKQAELNRQRILEEVEEIHLETEAVQGKNVVRKALATLGVWMVARGETLRRKNAAPQVHYSRLNKRAAHR